MRTFLKLSKYTYGYTLNNIVGIYHALNIQVLFITKIQWQYLNTFKESMTKGDLSKHFDLESIKTLLSEGFIIEKSENENNRILEIKEKELKNVQISILYLLLSSKCNLSCRYCFLETEKPAARGFMSKDTAKLSLDYFADLSDKEHRNTIILYGADPLMNTDTLKYSIKYTRRLINQGRLPSDAKITLITNGILITPELVIFLNKHRKHIEISVSLDGPPEIHNRNRVDNKGNGSYHLSIGGYKRLQEAGLKPGISCTLAPNSLENTDLMIDWLVDLKPSGIGFNTITDIPGLEMDVKYSERVAKFLIRAFVKLREKGIYEDRMMRKVKSFVKGSLYLKDCGGYGGQLVIAENGDIGVCHGYTETRKYFPSNIHSISNFSPFNDTTFLEWSKRSPINMSECLDCVAIGICGGGCAYNSEIKYGSIWSVDEQFCSHAKTTLSWLIEDLYSQMNN